MARISKDQLRQFIMDGKLSRSHNPQKQKQPSGAMPNTSEQIPSVASASKGKPKVSKKQQLLDYMMKKRGRMRTTPNTQPQEQTQPQVQQPEVPKPQKSGFPTYEQVQQQANQFNQDVINDRQRASEEADKYINQKMQGLTPEERGAYQESANLQLNRDLQNYKRMINADMGSRGIQGGAATNPKTELARYGLEAQQQFQRDLTTMEGERALQKLAAKLALQEGLVGQGILNRQQAFDYLAAQNASEESNDWLNRFYKDYYGHYPGEEGSKNDKLISMLESMGFKVNKKKKKSNKVGSRI